MNRYKKKKATCATPENHVYSFDQQGAQVVLTCATCGHSIAVEA